MTLLDMSNDATKLLDLLNIEKCVFVGHSMGARTAMFTALTQPSRIDKLVVVDSSPRLSNVKGGGATTLHYLKAMRAIVFDCSGSLSNARRNADKQLQEFIPESSLRQFILTNVEEKEPGLYGWRVNLDAIYEHIEKPRHIKLADDMRPYSGDTLFLGGGSSQFLRMDDYPYIKYLFPNCVISYVPECGHWVHSEKPVEFLSSVTSFLKPPKSFCLFEENTT
ncbi:unnamed protein product [Clavelina lepadiformis]|uniref:sn-1-specific diacylglycerol lipase ABHD11 n=1 Tax=Clavelina lepadiformis TaxID=159417 RepID=A0ABP0FD62_CLALP